MIRRLKVSSFRSLGRDVDLRLGRLTALVGPNGSGKSNVADAFQFLADCMHIGLEGAVTKRHGIDAVRRWSGGHPNNVSFHIEIDLPQGSSVYEFVLVGDRAEEYRVKSEHALIDNGGNPIEYRVEGSVWKASFPDLRPRLDPMSLALPLVAGDERFAPLANVLRGMAVYSIYPDALRQPQKYDPAKPMERHGANWVSVLKDQDPETWKSDLLEVLKQLTGDIVDIKVQPVAGYLTVHFEHQQEPGARRAKWFDPAQESDGTLRVAGMITALLQRPRPSFVAIEEPDLTVHPGALRVLYDYIREAGEQGQVLLTTHSPDLLDLLDTAALRVVARRDGATSVEPLDETQRSVVRDGLFTLGDVLRSEGLKQQQGELPLDGE